MCDGPNVKEATVTKEDMIKHYRDMFVIRRMEIACDTLYKQRAIRGFCHLYDGQEAVQVGMEAATELGDHYITAYRCHAAQYTRDLKAGKSSVDSLKGIIAEQLGRKHGCSKGKGGSMHLYNDEANFYGGNGIVGAQIPVGAGLAFGLKYQNKPHCAIACYGDGAANQGQFYEAMNMAALWKLPFIAVCENNNFAMGTSVERGAAMNLYYQRGQYTPGIRVDGMDILAVREATKYAKEWTVSGKGPIVLEFMTYRYHGHSMSDPGVTYRSRDDVQTVRKTRDPIDLTKTRILDSGFVTKAELKELEKEVRAEVQEAVDFSLADEEAGYDEMFSDIYTHYKWDDLTRTVEVGNPYKHEHKAEHF
jgi:pyruvate dehydrogenase E1 component alpha subunit